MLARLAPSLFTIRSLFTVAMTPHAFAALAPAQQLADLRPIDVWPVNNVSWDAAQGVLQLTVKHHAAKVELALVPAAPLLLSSIALWWHVAADVVLPLDKAHLRAHDPNHHWASYKEDITHFANAIAAMGESARRDVQMEAAQWLSPFPGQLLRAKTTDSFLSILAWDEDIVPAYSRVALVMWLSKWTATKLGRTLAVGGFTLEGDVIRPCPLTKREWEGRLKEAKNALSFHGMAGRIAAAAINLHANDPAPGQEEAWFTLMSVGTSEAPSDFLKSLDGFLAVPEDSIPNICVGLKALLHTMDLGANSVNVVSAVTSPTSLAAAVRAVYTMTPLTRQPTLRVGLTKTLGLVEKRWGSARQGDLRAAAAQALLPHLNLHEKNPSYDWRIPACELTAGGTLPQTALSQMLIVDSAISFRAAVAKALTACSTSSELVSFRKATEAALTQKAASSLQWFAAGGNSPTDIPPPATASTGTLAPAYGTPTWASARPTSAVAGLQPIETMLLTKCIRVEGARTAPSASVLSAGLTQSFGAPVVVDELQDNMYITVPKAGFDVVFAGSNCRVYSDPAFPNMTVNLYGKTTEDKDYFVSNKAVRHGQPGGPPDPVHQGKGAGKGRNLRRPKKWSKPNGDEEARPPTGATASLHLQRANGTNVVPLSGNDAPVVVSGTSFNGTRHG